MLGNQRKSYQKTGLLMKKLYLHMGFHKTGTSSFQETCKKNVGFLKAQGLLYPLFNSGHIGMEDISNHSIPIYSMFCEDPGRYHINVKHQVGNRIGPGHPGRAA